MSEDKILGNIVSSLNKKIGSGTACLLSKGYSEDFKCISTGSTLLDIIVANRFPGGGIPLGKITTITGDYSSGKSLLCYHLLANVQKEGGIAALIDTERSIEQGFIKRIGVNIDTLIHVDPGTCEVAFDAIDDILSNILSSKNDRPTIICWDSIAATPAQAEIDGEDFDPSSGIAQKARTISKALSMINEKIDKSNVALVLTNQLRTKIGGNPYTDPDVMPGGKAIPFYSTVIIKLNKGLKIQDSNKVIIGMECRAKTEKSKMSPPFRKCSFKMFFNRGIDDWYSMYEFLANAGVIEKRKGFRAIKLADGSEESFRESDWAPKKEDPAFKEYIYKMVKEMLIIDYTEKEGQGIESDEAVDDEE